MEKNLQNKIKEWTEKTLGIWGSNKSVDMEDPIIKLLLLALASETLAIEEQIHRSNQEIATLFRDVVLPYNLMQARPAFSILQVKPHEKISEPVWVDEHCDFVYEKKASKEKIKYTFKPLIQTRILPVEIRCQIPVQPNSIWLGIQTNTSVKSLAHAGFRLHLPKMFENQNFHIQPTFSIDNQNLPVVNAFEWENLKIGSIFEKQYPGHFLFGSLDYWREMLMENAGTLFYIADYDEAQVPLKPSSCPDELMFFLQKNNQQIPAEELLWIKVTFHCDNSFRTESVQLKFNCVPVVNIEAEQVVLDASNPIVKLGKSDDKHFLNLLYDETWRKYKSEFPFIVRSMDMERFLPSELQKQARYLFYRYISDYYAFKDMKGLRDGIKLNNVRKAINELYASVQEEQTIEYTGHYALLNLKIWKENEPVTLQYLCCEGSKANGIAAGETATVQLPALRDAVFLTESCGGKDKPDEDEKRHIARYHLLTRDKLVTQEDIRAFCYKELGDKIQKVNVCAGTLATMQGLCRGIKVNLQLKDRTEDNSLYYEQIGQQLQKRIAIHSSGVFPVEVRIEKNGNE